MRLNIADQSVPVDGLGNVTIRIRGNGSSTNWTDNGGRRAFLGGMLSTNFSYGSSITFNSGQHDVYALESGAFRPNPSAFDPNAANADNPDGQYTNNSATPAAFAMRFRSSLLAVPDLGYGALRDVSFDLASGALPLIAGTSFSGGSFGIESARYDMDASGSGLGQPIPDISDLAVGPWLGNNSASGSISFDSMLPKMTLIISVPFEIDLGDAVLEASWSGIIVAHALLIPEPSSICIAGLGVLGLACKDRRRLRRMIRTYGWPIFLAVFQKEVAR